jgi:hypothetical protein
MLTHKQRQVLSYVAAAIAANGVAPSHHEIAHAVGLASKGQVNRLLSCLRQRGFVDWTHGHARSLRLVEQASAAGLPLAPHRLADLDRIAGLHGIDRATCLDWLLEQAVRIFDHGSLPPPRDCNRPTGGKFE